MTKPRRPLQADRGFARAMALSFPSPLPAETSRLLPAPWIRFLLPEELGGPRPFASFSCPEGSGSVYVGLAPCPLRRSAPPLHQAQWRFGAAADPKVTHPAVRPLRATFTGCRILRSGHLGR